MGWYAMGLVDTLEYFPKKHPQRAELIAILNRLARAVAKYQEPRSGLWYDVLDKGTSAGNYLESSAACMFVYALAKGVRNGYLPASYRRVAEAGYRGIKNEFLKTDNNGNASHNLSRDSGPQPRGGAQRDARSPHTRAKSSGRGRRELM